MTGRVRLSRSTLLAFAVLIGMLSYSNWTTPSGRLGHLAELLGTLGLTALDVWLLALLYAWIEARVRPRLVPLVAVVSAASLGALLLLALRTLVPDVFAPPPPPWSEIVASGALNGALLLGAYVLVVRHPRAVEEARAVRLESELAALRARLEPHFLLNSLNAIAALVTSEPARARRALAALGDLLSEALEQHHHRWHTVAEELAWLRAYLTIFQARYDEALEVEWHLEAGLSERQLPRLLLQPLVENALVHGIAGAGAGRISIAVSVASPAVASGVGPAPKPGAAHAPLVVTITNTGPTITPERIIEGHGLELVRRRLALEAPGASLRLAPAPTGGAVAIVELPASRA